VSSNFVYQIRRYSGDPLAQRFKLLSEKLAQFEATALQLQTGDMKNYISITNSINQYKEQGFAKSKPVTTTFFLPFEPDLNKLTCWFRFDAWGKVTRDVSFQGNPGRILGQTPTAALGPDKGYGAAGTIAMNLDGSTQFIEVSDNANIQLVGQVTGFSIAMLIQPQTFAQTTSGENRYIAEKTDNPTNFWGLSFDTSGHIRFEIKLGGSDFSVVSTSTVTLNTWNWIVITFNTATQTTVIYKNGAVQGQSSTTVTDSDFTNVKTNLYVGATGANDGFFDGWISDFRYYRELVLTGAQVTNLNTNMITTSSIAFGAVATAGASLISA
jgi:hypothetical protein